MLMDGLIQGETDGMRTEMKARAPSEHETDSAECHKLNTTADSSTMLSIDQLRPGVSVDLPELSHQVPSGSISFTVLVVFAGGMGCDSN